MDSKSSSIQKVCVVADSLSVLPSLSSAFSLDNIIAARTPVLQRHQWNAQMPNLDGNYMTSSLKDSLDIFDDPNYTDTVTSTDSGNSLLRRSLSVPPEYTYKATGKRIHAREVFEDFIVPQDEVKPPADKILQSQGSQKKPWRQTMADLVEKPEYTDSLQSNSSRAILLAKKARSFAKGQRGSLEPCKEEGPFGRVSSDESRKYFKNLIVLSLSFMFVFTAYLALRNLQSSINQGSLGSYGLSAIYLFIFLGCILSTMVVQRLRAKNTIVISFFLTLLYTGANFYPAYYTLIPGGAMVGFSLAIMWTAQATYLTNLAASYAEVTGESLQNVISKFNGLFFMFFQVSQILGGVISSTVLMANKNHEETESKGIHLTNSSIYEPIDLLPNNASINTINQTMTKVFNASLKMDITKLIISNAKKGVARSLCGAQYCHVAAKMKVESGMDPTIFYVLMSVFAVCIIIGLVIAIFFLEKLEGEMQKSKDTVGTQLVCVFKFFVDWRVVLLMPLMFYSLAQVSFMFGEFTKSFVTCTMGVHMVGYVMLCLSVCAAVSAFINGNLQKYTGQLPLFIIAGLMHGSLLVTMLLWKPTADNLTIVFVLAGLWGCADGILNTQIVALIAVKFEDNKQPAFAAFKMCQSSGVCIGFVLAEYFCTATKIYILLGLLVVTMAGYITFEILSRRKPDTKLACRVTEV